MAQYDVYLAGAMGGRMVGAVLAERAAVKGLLNVAGLTYYDPADDEGLSKISPWLSISVQYSKAKMRRFVTKDLTAVSECKVVLNLTGDRISDGTCWEMAYAALYRRIPVYCVAPQRAKGELMGFTNILADRMFKDIESAVRFIKKDLPRGGD